MVEITGLRNVCKNLANNYTQKGWRALSFHHAEEGIEPKPSGSTYMTEPDKGE